MLGCSGPDSAAVLHLVLPTSPCMPWPPGELKGKDSWLCICRHGLGLDARLLYSFEMLSVSLNPPSLKAGLGQPAPTANPPSQAANPLTEDEGPAPSAGSLTMDSGKKYCKHPELYDKCMLMRSDSLFHHYCPLH